VNENVIADVLKKLDLARQDGGEKSSQGGIVREYSPDASECVIIYSRCESEELDDVVQHEITRAETRKYTLEWKSYGHDRPANLKDRLLAAGFESGPVESLMVLSLSEHALAAFDAPACDIRRIRTVQQLDDVAEILHQLGQTSIDEELQRYAYALDNTPDQMCLYAAYADDRPAACGRIEFKETCEFAYLFGGKTKSTHRNRGLYTALVAERLKEAIKRDRKYILVDALPTSEPILRKRGFQFLTHTQPMMYAPRDG
jgi:hypothetical protein